MRVVGGAWRGRALIAPPGQRTRPTADRARQALFDMLMHAAWGGRSLLDGIAVLDAFAGTGALGLEALSRGAGSACFIESDRSALRALRANIAACQAEGRSEILAIDVLSGKLIERAWQASFAGAVESAQLVFLDPPYGQNLVPRAIVRLRETGRIDPNALVVAEIGRHESWMPDQPLLAERQHGAARIMIFRVG